MLYPYFIGTLGIPELLIILFIILVIFGANKLPQLGAGLGQGIKNFKRSIKGDSSDSGAEGSEGSEKSDE